VLRILKSLLALSYGCRRRREESRALPGKIPPHQLLQVLVPTLLFASSAVRYPKIVQFRQNFLCSCNMVFFLWLRLCRAETLHLCPFALKSLPKSNYLKKNRRQTGKSPFCLSYISTGACAHGPMDAGRTRSNDRRNMNIEAATANPATSTHGHFPGHRIADAFSAPAATPKDSLARGHRAEECPHSTLAFSSTY